MRIENRVSPISEIRRTEHTTRSQQAESRRDPDVENTGDLLALSSAVRGAHDREFMLQRLAESWRQGGFRPDAGRIADKLMSWGFDVAPGDGK